MKAMFSGRVGLWILGVAALISFVDSGWTVSPATGDLWIGWASTEITPDRPVALVGQKHKRVSTRVRDPLTATALAIETKNEQGDMIDQAVMVSCDLIFIAGWTQTEIRKRLPTLAPDLDPNKVFLNATHTHTGPQQVAGSFRGLYDVSADPDVMSATDYGDFLVDRLLGAITEAWKHRTPGGISWGLGHAVVGHNRRAVYFDGTTQMYGKTNREDFDRVEGYEDHSLPLLFFWDPDGRMTGMVVNLTCPAQETESLSEVSADFWHEIREEFRNRHGGSLFLFPQCGSAGDISPHLIYRRAAEDRMRERRGLDRRGEIARRVVDGIDAILPYADSDKRFAVPFEHKVDWLDLPQLDPPNPPFYLTDDPCRTEVHLIRLGDIAIASNPFELYLDYGVRIQARSPALLTLIVQLSTMKLGYLPTEQAVQGGGYSAVQFLVGPEGGTVLVDKTVSGLKEMWE
ncbi:MAG: hypothetical protein KC994_21080 [Candidatus Omnitrophica bacterium]|nr:hypothetical protein [Candidatus Omnitrophota bacterium]